MDIFTIRRNSLDRYIRANFRHRVEFAEKIDKTPAQVGSWFTTGDGARKIGEKLAREIERKINKPQGWLDKLDNEPQLSDIAKKAMEEIARLRDEDIATILPMIRRMSGQQ